ncbi:MAG: hypothetical protein DPW18_03305 [Chloroflexi bacterium]|nr:hypothetical protein [Chloroflexota bacterium]MDL1943102.1 hypothetical protein [Chloroflexi bacterium CFX2]
MSDFELQKFFDFNESDLAANRLGQLTQKQKSLLAANAQKHRSLYTVIGIVVALSVGGSLVTALFSPVLSIIGGSLLESGTITPQALLTMLPVLCISGFVILAAGGILILVLRLVFEKANRKVDTTVRRAEGKVNFVWVERQERNTSKHGPMYRTVRSLEMRLGGETFTVNPKLPDVINQGEEWIFYYTNHPFKFLSAEKINPKG